jgi:uncharacterized spore protein YtfJ
MNNIDEMLNKVSDFLRSEAKTETIIGQPFQLGEFNCVPVMSIGMGFGGGGGEGKGSAKNQGEGEGTGAGAGAGMGMTPAGFLVTRVGEIQFIQAKSSKGIGAAFEKLPDLLDKYLNKEKPEKV